MNQPPPSANFILDSTTPGPLHYWLSCRSCPRESVDCGTDRNKLAPVARTKGYKLVPGLGWICNDCYWGVLFEVNISGTVETISS